MIAFSPETINDELESVKQEINSILYYFRFKQYKRRDFQNIRLIGGF